MYSRPFAGPRVIQGYGFGLGFAVRIEDPDSSRPASKGTYRWSGLANSFFWIDPKEDLIGIIITQLLPYRAYPLEEEFEQLVYHSIIQR